MAAEHEEVIETDHEYDGIREYDNRLPSWWLFTLYAAIVFSFSYWLYYHTFAIGDTAAEALALELQRAESEARARDEARLAREGILSDDSLVALAADTAAVARGKETFLQSCLACHGQQGEGTVGPNLTDAYWLHGHQPTQIHAVIAEGKLDKGMPAWRPVLGASRLRDVTAYVLSLKGSNVTGKAPQGVRHDGTPAPAAAAPGS